MKQAQRDHIKQKIIDLAARDSQSMAQITVSSKITIFLFIFSKNIFTSVLPLMLLLPSPIPFIGSLIRSLIYALGPHFQSYNVALNFITLFTIIATIVAVLRRFQTKITLSLLTFLYAVSPIALFFTSTHLFMSKSIIPGQKVLYILNLLGVLAISFYYLIINVGFSSKNSNYLITRPKLPYCFIELLRKIFSLLIPFMIIRLDSLEETLRENSSEMILMNKIIISIGILLTSSISLYYEIKYSNFLNPKASHIHRYILYFEIVVAILVFLCTLTKNSLLLQNFLYLIFSTYTFFYLAFERYTSYKIQEKSLQDLEEIETVDEILLYLYIIEPAINISNNLDLDTSSNVTLFLKNIENRHLDKCSNPECSCQEQDRKNDRMIITYINEVLEEIVEKFQRQDPLVLFYILNFQIKSLYLYTKSLSPFEHKKLQKNNFFDIFFLKKLKLSLQKYFREKNTFLNMANIEKVIESDQKQQKMLNFLDQASQLKLNFWSVLEKEITYYSSFCRNIETQLSAQKKIDSLQNQIVEQFGYCKNLLVTIIIYEKFILLKSEVRKDCLDHLQRSKNMGRKKIFRQKNKNLNKMVENYMFGEKCCTIESIINSQKMGIVFKASKNVENVFGFTPKLIQGSNINRIMPHSMRQEHNKILQKWVETGKWENIGQFRKIFAFSKNQTCFSAGIYLKVMQRSDSINIIAICFEENNRDYLIINDEEIIDGAGQVFLQLLGTKIVGIPLNLIANEGYKIKNSQNSIGVFHSIFQCLEEVQDYKSQRYKLGNAKNHQQKLQKMIKKTENQSEIIYEKIPYQMGTKNFTIYKFIGLRKGKIKENYLSDGNCIIDNLHVYDTLDYHKGEVQYLEDDEDDRFLGCENSSMGKSICNDGFTIDSIMENFYKIFINDEAPNDKKAKNVVFWVTLIFFICLAGALATYFVVVQGFKDSCSIFVSQKEQKQENVLLLITINNIVNLKIFNRRLIPIPIDFQMKLDFEREYTLQFWKNSVASQMKQGSLFRQNINEIANYYPLWTTKTGQSIRISRHNFISNLIGYNLRLKQLIKQGQIPQNQMEIMSNTLYQNYPEIKNIMVQSLEKLKVFFKKINYTIQIVCGAKFTFTFLLSMIGIAIIIFHNKKRHSEKIKIFEQFGTISKHNCSQIKNYFMRVNGHLGKIIKKKQGYLKEMSIEEQFEYFSIKMEEIKLENGVKNASSFKLMGKQESQKKTLSLIIFVALVFAINLFLFLWAHNGAILSEKMQQKTEKVESCRNLIMTNYIDLKMHIMFNSPPDQNFLGSLLQRIDQSQIQFIKAVDETLKFLNQSPNHQYSQRLLNIYVQDICENSGDLPEIYHQQCESKLSNNILRFGMINTLNFASRKLKNAVEFLNKPGGNMNSFKNFESTLFYWFSTSLKADKIVIECFNHMIDQGMSSYLITIMLQVCLYIFWISIGYFFLKYSKIETSEIYGMIYLIPSKVVRTSKQMIKNFLKFSNYELNKQ